MAAPPAPDIPIEELPAQLSPGKRLIGLDLGTVTIGMALSDPGLRIASPLATIRRTKFGKDAEALLAVCGREGVGGIILGLPINMNGTEGPRCQSARAFARNLLRLGERDWPIAFWDERLSSAAVNRMLIDEHDMTRGRRAEVVDKTAAAWILQGALDRLRAARS